jgi:tetratricopeptide (TPR) repeat protein
METYEKILELLEKKKLTPEEEKTLASLRKEQDAAEFIASYLNIKQALNKSHISIDELADYILYKEENPDPDSNISFRAAAIDAHLKECNICTGQFLELTAEYRQTSEFVGSNLYSDSKTDSSGFILPFLKRFNSTGAYAFASVIAVVIIYLGLFAVSGIVTPDNYMQAAINESSEDYLTRGRNTELFIKSFEALEANEYYEAIKYLKQDIKNNPDDETIFYSYYIMGLTYLELSESKVLGLFPSYDKKTASEGVNNLKSSVELNNSDKFENIKLDAYFYIAKGSLMLDDEKTAKDYLKLVISQKGGKMNEAAGILEELE